MELHATTILAVAKDGKVALGSDGQVTLDKTIMKHKTKKVRKLKGGKVVAGFAGSAATTSILSPDVVDVTHVFGTDVKYPWRSSSYGQSEK